MDKRERAALFRDRLRDQMQVTDVNQTKLARLAGFDRSTIAQILSDESARLPNAHLAAACAQHLNVSSDWLLGLTDRRERAGDIVAAAVSAPRAARTSADAQLMAWHEEAAGYKVRHVPATLPDVLKTRDVLLWEYERFLGKSPDQAMRAMEDRHAWLRNHLSDYEIAVSTAELRAFASGKGYYDGLARDVRHVQLMQLSEAAADYFPSLRIFLFEPRRIFSAPVTVFGPLLAVVYVGSCYLAFRSRDRVRLLANHFDGLVREADVDAREFASWTRKLADDI